MDPKKIAELETAATAAAKAAQDAGGSDEALNKAAEAAKQALDAAKALSQEEDPIKQELARVRKTTHSEAEKAAFSLKKNAERAKELGIDVSEVLGLKPGETEVDKNAPVTVGMLEEMKKAEAAKTALQLAEQQITDADELELTKNYLTTRIIPSGDPQADLRFARSAVNALKNTQILEEEGRRREAKIRPGGNGAPPKRTDQNQELTAIEAQYLKAPFNMTKEAIIAARPKES